MQLPDIKAGSNPNGAGSALDSEIQANNSVMQAINQGVANQLAIIQGYQQRKHARAEAQKERDFKADESKKQREHEKEEYGKNRQSEEAMNKLNNETSRYNTNAQIAGAKDRLLTQHIHEMELPLRQAQTLTGQTDAEMFKTYTDANGKQQIYYSKAGNRVASNPNASAFRFGDSPMDNDGRQSGFNTPEKIVNGAL